MTLKFFGTPSLLLTMAVMSLTAGCADDLDDSFYNKAGEIIAHPLPFEYTLSQYDGNHNIYLDKSHSTVVDAEKSALVLIDVWQNEFLDSLVIKNLNPLIKKFDAMGAKIIYAPSLEAPNENLLQLDSSIHLLNDDRMDVYLLENNIKNLFYVGFDTFYCVLDKENGIYSVRSRNKDLDLFLIDEGVLSYTKEMKDVAIELLKKNNVGIVKFDESPFDAMAPLNTIRDLFANTKDNIHEGNNFVTLFMSGSENQMIKQFEKELIGLNANYGTVVENKFYYRGTELSQPDYLKLLQDLGVNNLYFAGFYLNNEILWSDFGIRSLYIEVRYNKVKGLPWPYIVNDLAFIAPSEAMNPEIEKATIVNHCRIAHNIMSSTLIKGLKEAKTGGNQKLGKENKRPLL